MYALMRPPFIPNSVSISIRQSFSQNDLSSLSALEVEKQKHSVIHPQYLLVKQRQYGTAQAYVLIQLVG
jgi:hypothetical protein